MNDWISVKERLPPEGKVVMIGHTDGDMKFSGFLSCGQWYRYVGKWIPESDRHHLEVKTPTHWLPIPDLPKPELPLPRCPVCDVVLSFVVINNPTQEHQDLCSSHTQTARASPQRQKNATKIQSRPDKSGWLF